jgi:GNAT superfamily N-acetyltransferase
MPLPAILPLPRPAAPADLRGLAELLVDAVESGAAVSFVLPLSLERAEAWWRATLDNARAACLIARDEAGVAGSVVLLPAWAPNQPHRADLVKLLVHRRARRAGLGQRLMHAAEAEARRLGFTLLTLDAKAGGPAERLYRRLGWTEVGVIPRYALDPDGAPHDCIFFYKVLQ